MESGMGGEYKFLGVTPKSVGGGAGPGRKSYPFGSDEEGA